ncbi:MAG: tetratricopeptide repeat protein [Terriglobales bacterium]
MPNRWRARLFTSAVLVPALALGMTLCAIAGGKQNKGSSPSSNIINAGTRPERFTALSGTVRKDLQHGQDLLHQRRLNEAYAFYSAVIKAHPNDADAYCGRAQVFELSRHFDGAMAELHKAMEIEPKNPSPYRRLTAIYFNTGDLEPALQACNEWLKRSPNDAAGWFNKGDLLAQMGKLDAAGAALDRSLQLYPSNLPARRARAHVNNRPGGNLKRAIEDYTLVIQSKLDDDYTKMYVLRAQAYEKLGDFKMAIADYSTVLKMNPDDDDSLTGRAADYEKLHDYKSAIADYTMAIKLQPNYCAVNYSGRARAYRAIGQKDRAAADDKMAAKLKSEL